MIRIVLAAILCCGAVLVASRASGETVVTAAQVNGTWKTKGGEFKIWALSQKMLQVEFSGTYEYKSPEGPNVNTGEGRGVASIDAAEDECQITMKFANGKLVVTQTGTCGFGNNVTAEGTYKKISSRKPKFESGEGD